MSQYSRQLKLLILSILLTLLFFLIAGCSSLGFITYYDPTTYKSLTDLKPEVLALYDTFTNNAMSDDTIHAIRLKLAQIYEYEKGKGDKNEETYKQIRIIQKMFERHMQDRINNGLWDETHLNNTKKNISDAFDIAIKTERLKNKNE